MSYPDEIRAELDAAFKQTLKTSSFARRALTPKEQLQQYQERLAVLHVGQNPLLPPPHGVIHQPSLFRKRVLTPEVTMKTLISITGAPLKQELREAHLDISASAFCQQRQRLMPALFADLLTNFYQQRRDERLYKGYRVLAADGISIRTPMNRDSRFYIPCAVPSQSYCAVTACPLYDVLNNTFASCVIDRDEISGLLNNLAWFDPTEPTIIVGDRAYSSYYLCESIRQHHSGQLYFLIRTKNSRSGMKCVSELPMEELDREIEVTVSTNQAEAKKNGYVFIQTHRDPNRVYSDKTRNGRWPFPSPYTVKPRVVRIYIKSGYETLLTSLPSSFTMEDLKELYRSRWGIETSFRTLKYSIGVSNLHAKKDDLILQEVYSGMIATTLCSRIVNGVIVEQKDGRKYDYAVGFQNGRPAYQRVAADTGG